jgi:hypothetical protein
MTQHQGRCPTSPLDQALVEDPIREIAEATHVWRRPADALSRVAATNGETPDELLAETRFMLAQALWEAPPDRGRDRPRAVALAEQARLAFQEVGKRRAGDLAEVEGWIREHGDDP